ncbi:hypothetical protein GY45DRAFT_1336372 [Cubamyces sp. BRFM 1775]|nr:hypothetical protein GY45DRAFT_1336372 [Cubamyces sp. BRFM 1775]
MVRPGRVCPGFHRLSRRGRVFLYLFIFCVVLCGIFTGAFLIAGLVKSNDLGSLIDNAAGGGSGLALLGHAYDIDLPSRQVQISWLVMGCGSFAATRGTYRSKQCGRLNRAVDLYFDGTSAPNGSYDPKTSLLREDDTGDEFYIQATVEVQTQHLLEVTAWYGQDQQYAYPFDTYVLDTYLQALDPATNASVPTVFMLIADATDNLEPNLRRDRDVHTASAVVGSSTAAHGVQYEFTRTVLSKLFVMVLFVVNWLLTAVVVYIAVSAFDGVPLAEGVLMLPVSVILTIPALRALWVDAPAFGLLLDSSGTFLQMVIVSLASIYLVVNIGLRRQKTSASDAAVTLHPDPEDPDVRVDKEDEKAGDARVPLLPSYQ